MITLFDRYKTELNVTNAVVIISQNLVTIIAGNKANGVPKIPGTQEDGFKYRFNYDGLYYVWGGFIETLLFALNLQQ